MTAGLADRYIDQLAKANSKAHLPMALMSVVRRLRMLGGILVLWCAVAFAVIS